jgi:hypothetical protein
MPRQNAFVAENNFTKGLITETTAIKFPENACTETFNCVFDETGRVTRRLGFDLEANAVLEVVSPASTDVFTEFQWQTAGGDGRINFLVQQQGSILHFYDISDSLDASANKASFTVDLDDYAVEGSSKTPATEQCQYTINTGNLIVVNPACDPIYIVYDMVAEEITPNIIVLKERDFTGVDDGMDLFERPVVSLATLITDEPEHYYNLLNQGWYAGSSGTQGTDSASTLSQWDSARTDMPSNADTTLLSRGNGTDGFDNSNLIANSRGNRPAPKGHFILDVANPDRNAAATDEGFPLTLGLTSSFISAGTGSIIGNMSNMSFAFNGELGVSWSTVVGTNTANLVSTAAYVGKDYSGSPKQIAKATVYGSDNQGFAAFTFGGGGSNFTGSCTLHLRAKNGSAPSSAFDGDELGQNHFNDANNNGPLDILSGDSTTFYDYVWVVVDRDDSASQQFVIVEVQFYQVATAGSDIPITTERPTTCCTFAGRVWYAGIAGLGLNSSIYFTRIIRANEDYEKCYQANDPTSEDFFDLLPDDGGVVKIPEIGTVTKLFPYQSSLIIIATNGVWRISGGAGAFAANDFQVRKLSSIGSVSSLSFADYKGLPIWWGEDGIITLQYDPNYDSFAVISLTDSTIKEFILDIPETNRRYVKGIFDSHQDIVYWLYNSDESLAEEDYYEYDRVLVMNGISKAFYPWTIEAGDEVVRGVHYAVEGARTQLSKIKYTITNGTGMTFAETIGTTYHDWPDGDDTDYSSYFITGYRLDAGGVKFFQNNYVWVFMEEEADASCFMQGVWDWTTDNATGKWSTLQQIYNNTLTSRLMRFRRLKVRGKGKALQLRFESEEGKPFTIVGWAIKGSANADI